MKLVYFPRSVEGTIKMNIEVWLYGELSLYGGENAKKGFSSLKVELTAGATIGDLLKQLQMPTEKRGITFINGNLSALPDLQPDLDQALEEGDRISFFDLRSMWPFQYRHGAALAPGMNEVLTGDLETIIHHKRKMD